MRGERTRAFRISPSYDLVPFDRLTAGERAVLGEWGRDADGFGIVRPRPGTNGTIKAVSRDTALLLYALQTPGPIPITAVAGGDESVLDAVWRLVLDGVLEVERDGAFVSGAVAADLTSASGRPDSAVAAVSYDAVLCAARNIDGDALAVSRRLYQYNRRPLTPKWTTRIPTSTAVLRYVNAGLGQSTNGVLAQCWETKGEPDDNPWISWWSRSHVQRPRASAATSITYKLYVAPTLEALPDAFAIAVETLASAGAPPFKLASSARGLMRPDKFVCYFHTRESAEDVAAQLTTRLSGIPAHPVPFTRDTSSRGIVSLGADPPADRPMAVQLGVSWRQWVCRRLAAYLHESRKSHDAAAATEFALERIRLEGIDTTTWEPSDAAVRGFIAERAQ